MLTWRWPESSAVVLVKSWWLVTLHTGVESVCVAKGVMRRHIDSELPSSLCLPVFFLSETEAKQNRTGGTRPLALKYIDQGVHQMQRGDLPLCAMSPAPQALLSQGKD